MPRCWRSSPAARRAGARPRRPAPGRGAGSARRPAACVTPTCTPPPASTRPDTRRRCSDTRAPGSSRRSARESRSLALGDHVVTLFSPQCRECIHCLQPTHEPLPGDPRAAEQGLPARRHDAAFAGGRADPSLHGHARRSPSTRSMPEIALAKVNPEAPLDRACLFACGLSTGLGAAMFTAAVRAGRTCVVFGAGMVGSRRGGRLPAAGRRADHLRRPVRGPARAGARSGRDETAGAPTGTIVERVLDATGGFGADYTFEATGSVAVMREAVEAARMGWGLCTRVRRRRQGRDARRRSASADHRAARLRLLVRGGQGRATRCPSSSSATCAARSTWTRSSRIGCRSSEVNRVRADGAHRTGSVRCLRAE